MNNDELNGLLNKYRQEMSKIYNLYLSAIESDVKNRVGPSNGSNQQPLNDNSNNTDMQRETNVEEEPITRSNENRSNVNTNSSFLMNNAGVNNIDNKDPKFLDQSNNPNLTVNLNIDGSSSSQALFKGETSTINETYSEFLKTDSGNGILKVQVYTARQEVPINDALVVISKDFKDGKKIFYNEKTNKDGIIDNLLLPTPKKELSLNPSAALPFATYNIVASHPNYQQTTILNIPVFEGIKSIQAINLLPLQ